MILTHPVHLLNYDMSLFSKLSDTLGHYFHPVWHCSCLGIYLEQKAKHNDKNMVQPMYYSPVHYTVKQLKTMSYSHSYITESKLGILDDFCVIKKYCYKII